MFNPINLLNRIYNWFSEGISTKAKVIIALAGLFMIAGMGYTAYRINDYFEHDPNACMTCHVHDAQNKKWAHSEHKMVTCHECHHATKKEPFFFPAWRAKRKEARARVKASVRAALRKVARQ